MMRRSRPHGVVTQRGVGLVEIMIGMAVGLLLIFAISNIFMASRQTTRTQDDLSRMQETGRLALDMVGQFVRHAGYRANHLKTYEEEHGDGAVWIVASDGGGSGVSAGADSLTVRYDALVTDDTDCTGATVTGGGSPPNVVTAVFSLSGTDLRCGNGTSTQPLFGNIENMQVEYGLDTSDDKAVDIYVDGSSVTAANAASVVAIRVRLLVRSERDNVVPVKQTYTFNGGSATASDFRLRQEYAATFALRNTMP